MYKEVKFTKDFKMDLSPVTIVYIVVAIIGIIIALVLAYLGRQQSQVKVVKEKEIGKKPMLFFSSQPLKKAIFEEINQVLGVFAESEKISERISSLFSKELEKQINLTTQELSKKYNAIIEEKTKNEQIMWEKYKKALVEKKDTEAVLKSIAEGLVVVDSQGKVIMMNPAAEKLLGVSKKDKIGKNLLENLKDEQIVSLIKGSEKEREIELISQRDETKKILRASSAVIEDENGRTIGMVSVLSDITKQKELDRMKSQFIASVSHELRTPLVAIEKSISLLLNKEAGPISKTQEEFLSIAERNLKRLSQLINDLLDLSKLEAGRMRLEKKPSSIEKIIEECIQTFLTWANAKSIKIEKKIQPNLPLVNIDPIRINQVLTNLIGNAIKFTPKNGRITVEAIFGSEEIRVSVADTGIGIPKEALDKIFDKFYQVHERTHTDISGTGLGLSIAKEIVQLHGGKIWAESEKGKGAKFTFTLPYK
jgi:PAS domain S-box-containing protein